MKYYLRISAQGKQHLTFAKHYAYIWESETGQELPGTAKGCI